ncbi:DNA repair and recombination protein RadB [Candidatus Pacearchaeota archaeon]|nr:DNA repair and recombination protein RadB [Candidatus Pacearchaeota archaeon]|tara:strand:+ start:92 stop:841 length:750 start_codon:yes stop_codon:yes gene_type:complete
MESNQIQEEEAKILTGSRDLNNWLNGGYERGIITLFYGPSASGKSNFVTLTASHQAKKNKKIIFIDTEGSFSVERIKQISNAPDEILKNILILEPTNFQEQKKSFAKLLREIRESKNIGLIIVDSMTMLYRLELAEARKQGMEAVQEVNSDLANQMRALYEIARKRNIPVLITGQVYSEFITEEEWLSGKEAGVKIVGGDILKYWSKCIIQLENKNGKKKAILKKHRSLAEKELNFEIINEGIQKRGWF